MTTPRGFRDRSDDSLLTLLGEVCLDVSINMWPGRIA